MKANVTICANINAFKFEFGNGGKTPTLSPENSKGTGTSYQSLVTSKKPNRLDKNNITEGQQMYNTPKNRGKKMA